jgi:tRNA pseudouridine13 synthase
MENPLPLSYLFKTPGIGGKLKSSPEDFLVEEILDDGTQLELGKPFTRPDEPGGRFLNFVLEKRDWSSTSAISEIAKRLHTTHKQFSVAGNKDKCAITVQLASASGVSKEALLSLRIKDMSINGAWVAKDKVRIGSLLGNRFTIKLRDADGDSKTRVPAIASELKGVFPNYFGPQRFGSTRKNTHEIGLKLLKNDFEGAAISNICDSVGEKNDEARQAREELKNGLDFARALNYFPKHLRLERSMVAHLARKPGDYLGSFKQLPRGMLLLFIHAVQSHVFNLLLSERIAEAEKNKKNSSANPTNSPLALELERGEFFCSETVGFPDISKASDGGWIVGKIIGSETPINDREKEMLARLGIEKSSFRLKAIPEIASKGTYRTLLAPLKDFNFDADTTTFRFSLPAGSYATVAMREFMDKKS